ncbi:MAG: bacillithiol biosynthesis cysteine-adding enzyme BshC [Bacteroidota bacterium]
MQSSTIPLDETDCFSQLFIDYISGKEALQPFYNAYPVIDNFKETIKSRNFPDGHRQVLVDVLQKQYSGLETTDLVYENISRLRNPNTFTITTGHQLNIFTGPLYFIYKIVTVIKACQSLKEAFPDCHFVPVYWMASEDHDFEEINHFYFQGQKHIWKTNQDGAVGHFDPSSLAEVAERLPDVAGFFKEAYLQQSLAEAVRFYVNYLFRDEGLIVLDADDASLKKILGPVMEEDVFSHTPEKQVNKTSEVLEKLGYKRQIHAREINFLFLEGTVRERLEQTKNGYKLADDSRHFSENEIKELLDKNPEKLSPNVAIRPLYQEMILPNLAYVGGPSEGTYWLQLKGLFDHFKIPFPILLPRNFGIFLSERIDQKWKKMGLDDSFLFKSVEANLRQWVLENSPQSLSFQEEMADSAKGKKKLVEKAAKVDPTLGPHLESIHTSYINKLEKAQKKLIRAEKRKYTEKERQFREVNEWIFPEGTLQERKLNFLEFYMADPNFIQGLLDHFDPFTIKMYLLKAE